ncbi:endo-1,4-beta-glucanase, partial [Streptomyces diastatochromogenes]
PAPPIHPPPPRGSTRATPLLRGGARPGAPARKKVTAKWSFALSSNPGTEVFKGSGRLETKSYSVDIG